MKRSILPITLLAIAALVGGAASAALAQDGAPATSRAMKSTQRTSAQRTVKSTSSKTHKVAIQVDENDPKTMNLALNNARNVAEYYKSKGENVSIEIVTFGPGLHMLRDDTSPVKQRIAAMALETPNIAFIACGNTRANMSKQENKQITLISEAKLMPSGVVHLMELQGKGYAYIRP